MFCRLGRRPAERGRIERETRAGNQPSIHVMRMITSTTSWLLCGLLVGCGMAAQGAQPASPSVTQGAALDADTAWSDLLRDSELPQPPEAWRAARPSQEELEAFEAKEGERLAKAATQANDFQKRFPKDPRVKEASSKEHELLDVAAQLGNTNVLARLEALEAAKLRDSTIPEDERFQIAARGVNRRAMDKLRQGRAAAFAELENGARALLKQFPNRLESYEMLQMVAFESEPEKAAKLAKEILESDAPDQVKDAMKPLLRLGKPVPIKFTAVDGREVDMEKLRGKVVLVDCWATWCGPCVQELPNVRAAYERLHPKGFEIVGISFDREKSALLSFVKKEKMTWPQYFDGKHWDNDFGKLFGIQGIPAMWLVDKKGILRDVNARADLAIKVEKLLAEKP